jgi:hypothetical protein
MEEMRMHETYDTDTPEQLAQLEARREEVGEDQIGLHIVGILASGSDEGETQPHDR